MCQSLRIVDHKNWTCKEKHYASHDGSVCHDRGWHKVVPQFVSVQLVYKYYNVWVFGGYIELVIGSINQLTSLRGAPPNATWPPSTTSPEICQHQPHGFGSVNFGVSNTRLRLQIHQNHVTTHEFYYWLVVVYPPLWKIWVNWDDEIPNTWENKKCSKPPTRLESTWTFE